MLLPHITYVFNRKLQSVLHINEKYESTGMTTKRGQDIEEFINHSQQKLSLNFYWPILLRFQAFINMTILNIWGRVQGQVVGGIKT